MSDGRKQQWQRLAADRSGRVPLPLLLAVLLVAAASWLFSQRGLDWELHSGDAHEYAEMARRISRGEGFTTGVLFPAELHLGATTDHPAVVRPPLWPLSLAGFFAVTGPRAGAVYAAVLFYFLCTAAAATALAAALAGPLAGGVAGIAVSTSPQLGVLAIDGVSETLFAFTITLALLLCARRRHAFWIGGACGLAYLTRYNGVALLPVCLALVALRPGRSRALLACAAGFAVTAAPWWLRNAWVTGDPFYSLLSLNLAMSPEVERAAGSLLYTAQPDLHPDLTMEPAQKLRHNLPLLLRQWPLASANLAACLGVALACARREGTSLAFAAFALVTTGGVALGFPYGRYFAPLVPALLALGAAAWVRQGGRAGALALALLLAAPLLPSVPGELTDMKLFRAAVPLLREVHRRGEVQPAVRPGAPCFAARPLVIAQAAARVAWEGDAVAIYAPSDPEEFWRIVRDHPVEYAQIAKLRGLSPDAFAERFTPRPDCGAGIYQRRPGT